MDSISAVQANEQNRTFTLGAWTIDGDSNQIVQDDNYLTIEPKMMDVLIYLCQNAGETVSAEQLLIACWAGTFYGDAPVQKCIAGLRKKLGCNAKSPSYIETIYRRGYKIIAPVTFPSSTKNVTERQTLPPWTEGSPYLGLNAFNEQHRAIFFGRTKAIVEVIELLKTSINKANNFLLILGKSGSGKSSLMRAGVVPQLINKNGFSQLRISDYHFVTPSQSIDESPIATLIHALQKLSLIKPTTDISDVISKIEADPQRLKNVLGNHDTAQKMQNDNESNAQVATYKLLVIDQFEQFLLDENLTTKAKQNLVCCLSQIAQCKHVLFTAILRNDFYAECLDVKGFYELKDQGQQYDLQAPTPVEISRMIRNPAIAAGLSFEHDKQKEEHLDELLLEAAVKNPDALPLLEYTLELLYQQRSQNNVLLISAYRQMGGIEGAIAQQAEKVFAGLPADVQACWDNIMHALIQVDHKNKHSVTARKLPISYFKLTAEKQFIQRFLDARLFVTIIQTLTGEQHSYLSDTGGHETLKSDSLYISIAHEALLKHWQRIQQWLNNNRVAIHQREQLADDCQFWLSNNKANDALLNSKQKVNDALALMNRQAITLNDSELAFIERSKRYQGRKKILLSLSIIALFGFSVLTWFQAKQVANERDIALSQSQRTQAISKFLTDTLAASSPFVAKGKDVSLTDVLADASDKLNASNQSAYPPYVEALLHKTLGLIYIDLGKIKPAEHHLNKGLAIYQENQLEKGQDYLGLLFNISRLNVLKYGRDTDLALIKETIEVSKSIFGEDHKDTLGALDNLATYYLDSRDFNQAEAVFRQVYTRRKQLFGEEFRHTLYSIENLGDLYFTQQNYQQADYYYQLCTDKWLAKPSGINNPYTLYCMKGLSNTKLKLGQNEQAETILNKQISAGIKTFGSKHPEVLFAKHQLATLYQKTDRHQQAETLFRQTLQIQQEVLGKNHQATIQTQTQLTNLLDERSAKLD